MPITAQWHCTMCRTEQAVFFLAKQSWDKAIIAWVNDTVLTLTNIPWAQPGKSERFGWAW